MCVWACSCVRERVSHSPMARLALISTSPTLRRVSSACSRSGREGPLNSPSSLSRILSGKESASAARPAPGTRHVYGGRQRSMTQTETVQHARQNALPGAHFIEGEGSIPFAVKKKKLINEMQLIENIVSRVLKRGGCGASP